MNASFQVRTIVPLQKRIRLPRFGALSLPPLFLVVDSLLVVLLVLTLGGERPAVAFDLNASWRHILSGADGAATRGFLTQNYRASDSLGLNFTQAMNGSIGIGYNRTQASGKEASNLLTPNASFQVNNDIFQLALAGATSLNRRAGQPEVDTTRWQTTLSPRSYPWAREFWPSSSVHYSDTHTTSSGRIDSHLYAYGANLSWGLPDVVQMFYAYDDRRTENRRTDHQDETAAHTLRLLTGGEFFENRLRVNLTQGMTHNTVTSSGVVGATGIIEKSPQVDFTYFSRKETTDPAFNGRNFSLAGRENPDLANLGNQTTIDLGPDQSWYLSISPVFAPDGEQQTGRLRVYVDDPYGEVANVLGELRWALYASVDNANWDPVAGDLTAAYDSFDNRFQLDIPEVPKQYQYLMVVLSNRAPVSPQAVPVKILAVETVPLAGGIPGSTYSFGGAITSYTTNADMSALLTSDLRLSTNLASRYSAEYFNGDLRSSLSWRLNDMINPSLGFSETLRKSNVVEDESIYRAYSFALPIRLQPTLNVHFGITRVDNFKNSLTVNSQNRFLFGTTAILYPDLTASLVETYNTGNRVLPDGTNQDEEDFGGVLTLNGRLTPKLDCELTNNFYKTYKPEARADYSTGLRLDYRPSDPVSIGLNYTKVWVGTAADSREIIFRMALLSTRKTRVNFSFNYSHSGTQEDVKNMALLASWDISRIFTLKSQGVYSFDQYNSWSILTNLYMRL